MARIVHVRSLLHFLQRISDICIERCTTVPTFREIEKRCFKIKVTQTLYRTRFDPINRFYNIIHKIIVNRNEIHIKANYMNV